MINAMRAYLQTEGKLDYRNCMINYYTFSMFDTPNKYRINVNVHIQTYTSPTKKTLSLDKNFDSEQEAIDYGIAQGKEYIDKNYENGKIIVILPNEKEQKSSISLKSPNLSKQTETKKKDSR